MWLCNIGGNKQINSSELPKLSDMLHVYTQFLEGSPTNKERTLATGDLSTW